MTYGCCIPWCKEPGKSKFSVSKSMLDAWEDSLNLKLRSSLKICEYHFDPNDIKRTWEPGYGDYKLKANLLRPRLRPGAIPKHPNHDNVFVKITEFLNFPSSNKKKELKDYRNVLHDHPYCIPNDSVSVNSLTVPWSHANSSSNEYLALPNLNFFELPPNNIMFPDDTFNDLPNLNYSDLKSIIESTQQSNEQLYVQQTNSILMEPITLTSENIYWPYNSLHCDIIEENKLLISCSCCFRGIDFGNLIQCSSCKKVYHYLCHIPSITQNKIENLLKKSVNVLNKNYQPDVIDSSLSNWKCTLCINLKLLCKKISQKDPSSTNYSCERAVMKNIVLKLYCQTNDSMYFRTCPDKQLFPFYYDKIKNPISLDDIKAKLTNTSAYKLFLHLIQDVQLLISNVTKFYPISSFEYNSAINLQTTFRINLREVCDYLIKYTPKNQRNKHIRHLNSSNSSEKNVFFRPGVKSIMTKPFSESDIKYLMKLTNNFMREDIFKEKFLKFLIKDRFKDRTILQLLHKLHELYMKYKGVNNNISTTVGASQPLKTIDNVYISKPQPSVNNLIPAKKHNSYSKADIEYLCQKSFNYNSLLIHDDFFLQSLIEDRFKDRTVPELRSKLLNLENNFLNFLKNEQNHLNFDCIRV